MEILIFLTGIVMGSFLNVLIYRLPLNISLIDPARSVCPACKKTIKWYENIPLVSYFLILKGRCSSCNEKISISYPVVELITGIVTLLLFMKLGFTFKFITMSLLFYTLIVLSFIDFKYKAVPDYLLILALFVSYIAMSDNIIEAVKNSFLFAGAIALLELIVTFYIQNIKAKILKDESLKTQRSMGEGDIPIFAVIGAVAGIKFGFLAIFLSAVFALVPSLIKKDLEIPFIPFLSLGLFVAYLLEKNFINLLETTNI